MWKVEDGVIWVSNPLAKDPNDENSLIPLCEEIGVAFKRVDLLTGEEEVEIYIKTDYDEKRFFLNRKSLVRNKILPELLSQGLTIVDSDEAAGAVLGVLLETEKYAPVEYHHNVLGFTKLKDKTPCFLGYHPVGLSGIKAESVYEGSGDLEPKGSYEKFRWLCEKVVCKTPELCLGTALAITAPTAYVLKEHGVFTDLPVWGIVGHSSIGKTTLMEWGCSLIQSPEKGLRNFNTTENAFYAMQAMQQGIPFFVDECSHVPGFDLDSMLYTLPTGRKKDRCNGDGNVKPVVTFSGATILSSEKSIIERTMQNPGETARIVEFTNKWTVSANQSDLIKRMCRVNYGWGAKPIAELFLNRKFQKKLCSRFIKTCKNLREKVPPKNGVDERFLQREALILVSLWAAEKALKIGLHKEKVIPILERVFAENKASVATEEDSEADTLLDKILSEVSLHGSKFIDEDDVKITVYDFTKTDIWGMKGFRGNHKTIWILKDVFRKIISETPHGIKTALKLLESKGYTKRFRKDGFLHPYDMGHGDQNGYLIIPPTAKTAFKTMLDLKPDDRNLVGFSKTLKNDHYGSRYNYSEIYKPLKEIRNAKPMLAGIIRYGSQDFWFVINEELRSALSLRDGDKFYLAPEPLTGLLLIGKEKFLEDCFELKLMKSKNNIWNKDSIAIESIAKALNMEIGRQHRLVFSDIEIEKGANGQPYAVIDVKNENCVFFGLISEKSPEIIEDVIY